MTVYRKETAKPYGYVLINNQEWETSQTIDKKKVKTTILKKQTKIQAKKPKNYEAQSEKKKTTKKAKKLPKKQMKWAQKTTHL